MLTFCCLHAFKQVCCVRKVCHIFGNFVSTFKHDNVNLVSPSRRPSSSEKLQSHCICPGTFELSASSRVIFFFFYFLDPSPNVIISI